jgi:3-oxoacyl-[acyl-carrier protein] reductase
VTGGGSGIGLAVVRRFIAAGALVLIVDRRAAVADIARAAGAEFFQADVAREEQVAAAFEVARKHFESVHILVNNAGIQPLGVGFDGLTCELLQKTFEVNTHSAAFGIKYAVSGMAEGGRVINITSFVGALAAPGTAVYAASKAALIHLTRVGAIELAPRRITVNAVSPGTIRTPAVTRIDHNPEIAFIESRAPLRRLGEPEEVAALCHFLAADEAAYITGQNIAIDGGLTAGWTEYQVVPPPNIQNGRWVDDV